MVYSIPSLVGFEELFDPMKKTYFQKKHLKLIIGINRNFRTINQIFFLHKLFQKILSALQSMYTWDTQYRVWFDMNNFLTQ